MSIESGNRRHHRQPNLANLTTHPNHPFHHPNQPNHLGHHPDGIQLQTADTPITPVVATVDNTKLPLADPFPKRMRNTDGLANVNNPISCRRSLITRKITSSTTITPNNTQPRTSKRLCRQKLLLATALDSSRRGDPVVDLAATCQQHHFHHHHQRPVVDIMSPTVIVANQHLHLSPLSSEPIVDSPAGPPTTPPPAPPTPTESDDVHHHQTEMEKSATPLESSPTVQQPSSSTTSSTTSLNSSTTASSIVPTHVKKAVQTKPFPIRGKFSLKKQIKNLFYIYIFVKKKKRNILYFQY